MRVERIQLYHFRGFEDLQIQFPTDANTIAFIGDNGSGKTSLLEGISMILKDTLQKKFNSGDVDWNNPLNVYSKYEYGSISVAVKIPKHSIDFTQTLSADRTRFISEDKRALDYKRDLTDTERIEHYNEQAETAYELESYPKALEQYLKLAEIQEKVLGFNNTDLALTYQKIGLSIFMDDQSLSGAMEYLEKALDIQTRILPPNHEVIFDTLYFCMILNDTMENSEKTLEYFLKIIAFEEKKSSLDQNTLTNIYLTGGYAYLGSQNKHDANLSEVLEYKSKPIEFFKKALEIQEKIDSPDKEKLKDIYMGLIKAYDNNGNVNLANSYTKKLNELNIKQKRVDKKLPELQLQSNSDGRLKEYLDVWTPIVLHYSARQSTVETYKDAQPIAFHIPMTTDFDMISDWFIEHENDENRKRLRINQGFRSTELESIRTVIIEGLTHLNGKKSAFTELQTEVDESVIDGQVSSWLSIKKDGLLLNVNQLSDGEKRVLVLFIDITRRLITAAKQNNESNFLLGSGIVLVDEIEQHLHPKWQRTLLPTLSKLFPNLQFIVTTHSPQVLSYVPNGCSFSLDNGKAFPLNSYGRDNEWILETIMDDVARPQEIQEKLDEYFELIKKNQMERASDSRQELEQLIGIDEPELLKADILIRKKRMVTNETNS